MICAYVSMMFLENATTNVEMNMVKSKTASETARRNCLALLFILGSLMWPKTLQCEMDTRQQKEHKIRNAAAPYMRYVDTNCTAVSDIKRNSVQTKRSSKSCL